jgi:general secretion pathway protein G
MKALHDAVIQFYMDQGRYPEDLGLQELLEQPSDSEYWPDGGYLNETSLPKDGWGQEFIYERYPESGKPFVIISYGADKEQGGEGKNEDLYSTDAN